MRTALPLMACTSDLYSILYLFEQVVVCEMSQVGCPYLGRGRHSGVGAKTNRSNSPRGGLYPGSMTFKVTLRSVHMGNCLLLVRTTGLRSALSYT
jgi:hypothetical protein